MRRVWTLSALMLFLTIQAGSTGIQVGDVSEPAPGIEALRGAVDLDPEDAGARRALGVAYFRSGRVSEAIAEFEAAIALVPLEESLHLVLTDMYWMLGQTSEAEAAAIRAVGLMPESQRAHQTLADIYANSGRLRQSLPVLTRAIELDGPLARDLLYQKIGDAYAALAQFDQAEAAYLNALEADPDAVGPRLALGNVYARSGRFSDAAGQYERVSTAHPENVSSRVRLAEVYLRLGRLEEATETSSEVLRIDPTDRGALYLRGTARVRLGRTALGEADLEAFRRLESEAASAEHRELEVMSFNREAVAMVGQERYQEAIDVLSRGIEARPDAGSLYLNLGLIRSQMGDHRGAVDTFNAMLRLGFDDDPAVHRNLAREYELLGDLDASRTHRSILLERFGLSR